MLAVVLRVFVAPPAAMLSGRNSPGSRLAAKFVAVRLTPQSPAPPSVIATFAVPGTGEEDTSNGIPSEYSFTLPI